MLQDLIKLQLFSLENNLRNGDGFTGAGDITLSGLHFKLGPRKLIVNLTLSIGQVMKLPSTHFFLLLQLFLEKVQFNTSSGNFIVNNNKYIGLA